jgi:hypothetical protein
VGSIILLDSFEEQLDLPATIGATLLSFCSKSQVAGVQKNCVQPHNGAAHPRWFADSLRADKRN